MGVELKCNLDWVDGSVLLTYNNQKALSSNLCNNIIRKYIIIIKNKIFVINFFTNQQWNFEAIGKIGQIDLEPVDIQ